MWALQTKASSEEGDGGEGGWWLGAVTHHQRGGQRHLGHAEAVLHGVAWRCMALLVAAPGMASESAMSEVSMKMDKAQQAQLCNGAWD